MSENPRSVEEALIRPAGRVLSTLEADGSRRWLTPRLAKGRLFQARRLVAYGLIAIFALTPYIQLGGKPLILLDVVHRRFHLFGITFLPTDTTLLALLVLMFGLSVFLFTALAGRVFCGWACPQTVYLEFLYRPLERLFYGTAGRGGKPKNVLAWRRVALHAAYLVISVHLAHTALSFFIGASAVHEYIWRSTPFAHPAAFIMVAIITAWMMWDFAYWREQMCLIGCPYGRFQSVLLDRWSQIVSYDAARGEPRGKKTKAKDESRSATPTLSLSSLILQPSSQSKGDCIDCTMCVQVCPTGIDIRDGLQFECVNCTQCIDACDSVMDRISKPRGLIGYSSQAHRAGERTRWIRPRVVVYPMLLLIVSSLFVYLLLNRSAFDLTILRAQGRPFVVDTDGFVENVFRIKLVNRTQGVRTYHVESTDGAIEVVSADETITLNPLESAEQPIRVRADAARFTTAHLDVQIRIRSDAEESADRFVRLVGPSRVTPPTTQATEGAMP